MVEPICVEHRKHGGRCGQRRMTPEISEARGQRVNHKRIGRWMRLHEPQSHKRRRRRMVATDSKNSHPVAPNVRKRDFHAPVPNQKWLG